jgi:hypothetical protein
MAKLDPSLQDCIITHDIERLQFALQGSRRRTMASYVDHKRLRLSNSWLATVIVRLSDAIVFLHVRALDHESVRRTLHRMKSTSMLSIIVTLISTGLVHDVTGAQTRACALGRRRGNRAYYYDRSRETSTANRFGETILSYLYCRRIE